MTIFGKEKMKKIWILALVLVMAMGCSRIDKKAVAAAIERQLDMFPVSTLQDIYKSFYQEAFGPGHIIEDEYSAAAYFYQETSLSTEEPYGDYLFEPTGIDGGYYRISLYAVQAGILPAEVLLSAFLRSAEPVTSEGIKEWKKSWRVVEKVAGDFGLPGYEADRAALDAILQSDSPDKAVHHSDAYNEAYDPHYRIVRKDIFEAEILPILQVYQPPSNLRNQY